ncbi:MAG: DUF3078 domain-containing protein [Candidatus Zixiibacteriota bacterium]
MSKISILLFVALVFTCLSAPILAREDTSQAAIKTVIFDFTTTQTSYSDSWVGGEAGSLNWVSNLNAFTRSFFNPKFEMRSRLKLSFGQTLTQDADTKQWSRPQKSTDLIDFESVGSYLTKWPVNPYVAFRAETQFYDGRNSYKKLFLTPLKLTESAGATRKFYEKDKDYVASRLGPGIRQIITKSITDTVTLATESETTTDAGFESVSEADIPVHKNIRYYGKLSLYKALAFSKSDEVKGTSVEDYWKSIDVNFENSFNAAVTKIIAVNLYLQLLYDKEISKKGRIKETVALGLTFRMI